MPEITLLGWFHTIIAILSILIGAYALYKFKFIEFKEVYGRIYIIGTAITAATALMIFNATGSLNVAHGLAMLTLVALVGGLITEYTRIFGSLSRYLQCLGYSSTFLFHMVPAITDGLRRLPPEAPIVTEAESPLLGGFYLLFLVVFIIGVGVQFRLLYRSAATA